MDFFQSPEVVRFEYTNEILVRENPDYWSKKESKPFQNHMI